MSLFDLLTTLITSGAFVTIYLVGDKKTSNILDNINKSSEQWQKLVKETQEEKAALEEKLNAKENKIDSKQNQCDVLRDKCDKLSSKIAYYRAFECRKIKCLNREPPFGTGAFLDEDCKTCKNSKKEE